MDFVMKQALGGATKDMGKMLGGEEEKDPDAQKKEEERQEALRQQEEERKAKHARMEAGKRPGMAQEPLLAPQGGRQGHTLIPARLLPHRAPPPCASSATAPAAHQGPPGSGGQLGAPQTCCDHPARTSL
uniref:Complexin-2 n=1 Tax=Taeniopygia guttata TaxID=59729 RepID=B5G051_TAEGU|nr:putative complexin 2 variant 2 [Taeniopygia guttata]